MEKGFLLYVFGYMVLGVLTACSNGNSLTADYGDEEFKIISMIAPLSRTPQLDENGTGKFTDGDQNSLFFFSVNRDPISTYLYTYGLSSYWSDLGLSQEILEISLTGCYPPVFNQRTDVLQWDVSIDNAQKDFLLSAPITVRRGLTTAIPLVFTHALHKICVELVIDKTSVTDEMEKDVVITCRNVFPVANISLKEGVVTNASGSKTSFAIASKKATFIIPPQAVGDIEIDVHINNKNFTYRLIEKLIDGKPLRYLLGEHMLILKIAVSNESFSIVGQEINGWESQGEINDSIIF